MIEFSYFRASDIGVHLKSLHAVAYGSNLSSLVVHGIMVFLTINSIFDEILYLNCMTIVIEIGLSMVNSAYLWQMENPTFSMNQ